MDDQVQKARTGHEWPDDHPFPLTPEEAYWIMRGWLVLPASTPNVHTLLQMPGRMEMIDGNIKVVG
jgi:hypothetical protein